MRALTIIPLFCLLAGCLAPGERDPTRYPWDPANRPHPPIAAHGAISPQQTPPAKMEPPHGTYCVVALTPPNASGITFGGKANPNLGCPTGCITSSNAWVTDGKQPKGPVICALPGTPAPAEPKPR